MYGKVDRSGNVCHPQEFTFSKSVHQEDIDKARMTLKEVMINSYLHSKEYLETLRATSELKVIGVLVSFLELE